eukprot:Unigene4102_Nuclearia_a/m.12480 Unigene4102_Nuclearia_a/g.12480  ORF Unigene4102_Nuclearia_a/g.12480 Unigene4102_Nuclearia_a/m.12480 type:complete len:615 (+) Unigene4102_Nuclearia_a:2004-3848(+)
MRRLLRLEVIVALVRHKVERVLGRVEPLHLGVLGREQDGLASVVHHVDAHTVHAEVHPRQLGRDGVARARCCREDLGRRLGRALGREPLREHRRQALGALDGLELNLQRRQLAPVGQQFLDARLPLGQGGARGELGRQTALEQRTGLQGRVARMLRCHNRDRALARDLDRRQRPRAQRSSRLGKAQLGELWAALERLLRAKALLDEHGLHRRLDEQVALVLSARDRVEQPLLAGRTPAVAVGHDELQPQPSRTLKLQLLLRHARHFRHRREQRRLHPRARAGRADADAHGALAALDQVVLDLRRRQLARDGQRQLRLHQLCRHCAVRLLDGRGQERRKHVQHRVRRPEAQQRQHEQLAPALAARCVRVVQQLLHELAQELVAQGGLVQAQSDELANDCGRRERHGQDVVAHEGHEQRRDRDRILLHTLGRRQEQRRCEREQGVAMVEPAPEVLAGVPRKRDGRLGEREARVGAAHAVAAACCAVVVVCERRIVVGGLLYLELRQLLFDVGQDVTCLVKRRAHGQHRVGRDGLQLRVDLGVECLLLGLVDDDAPARPGRELDSAGLTRQRRQRLDGRLPPQKLVALGHEHLLLPLAPLLVLLALPQQLGLALCLD